MSQKRILIVDDEAGFTRLLKMNLEKGGQYQVMIENRSSKAVLAAKEFKPDAILLDIVMPEMDGGDVMAALQADPEVPETPIIMLTALVDDSESSKEAAAVPGQVNLLSKPVDLEVLLRCLDEVLGAA